MQGRVITDQQMKLYMSERGQGATQPSAAAKAEISERSGRRVEQGQEQVSERHWRTRADPFEAVWSSELVGLLEPHPELSPLTLLEHLQERHPGEYPDTVLRTLQRRVKQWRALHGQSKAVILTQRHEPGEQGLSDFTELKEVTVQVGGEALTHLLYHLSDGVQRLVLREGGAGRGELHRTGRGSAGSVMALGWGPREHRTDSLSAAYRNINADQAADLTQSYEAMCTH